MSPNDENERWKPPVRRGVPEHGAADRTSSASAPESSPADAAPEATVWRPKAPLRPLPESEAPESSSSAITPEPATEPGANQAEAPAGVAEPPRRARQHPTEEPYIWTDRLRTGEAATAVAPVTIVNPIVAAEGLSKDYPMGDTVVHALKPLTFRVPRGQLVALHGRSGSGKTTLLNMIGGLDQPTSGSVSVDGANVTEMSEIDRVQLRRHQIGFIFQAFGLIPILSAAENVEVPLRLAKVNVMEREERVRVLLELVGLGERGKHRPFELSGGEQQRVAIARALANGPRLLLADEPTGQLDSQTGRTIMTLIRALVKSEGVTAIVATHDPILIDLADRVIELRDGVLIEDSWAS
ncbi:MAG TPA: ABC transporter ATP-binding protein [Thermomicrobiaceae bacterium]|nr:ABC transporter ATP-binding protein [Thermomicrobiaceae bacterium]